MENTIDTLASAFLFKLDLDIKERHDIGAAPGGHRRVAPILGGDFEGPRLRGTVLPGGADWVTVRSDQVMLIDVRITLKTDDEAMIYMHYHGVAAAPADVMERVNRSEVLDYSDYYVRNAPRFETGAARYAWLNNIIAVGNGMRTGRGATYRIFEIL